MHWYPVDDDCFLTLGLCLRCAPQLGKDDYDPEPDMQAVAVHRAFNSSCAYDRCYEMGSICRDELASDGKDEAEQFCRRWCCALLVASGRNDVIAMASSLHAKDDVPMVIIGESGACKSLSDGATDEWCTNTCKDSDNCPANLCECDDDNTEQVAQEEGVVRDDDYIVGVETLLRWLTKQ